jgi:transglutaminase-like putative cysteine protease
VTRYRVEHSTRYVYAAGVSTSQHVAHLRPRALPAQHVAWTAVEVAPLPARSSRRVDYFGNAVDQFTVLQPHQELTVRGASLVEVDPPAVPLDAAGSAPWEEARDALRFRPGAAPSPAVELSHASPYVERGALAAEYARPSFPPGRPVLEAAIDLMGRIHRDFRFDSAATTITTPVRRVFEERRGVCQDFAHLQISCLRSLGLAARYVSGYLLTDPPPGQPRLLGADASHAWLAVHCPRRGWVDLDPTNDLLPGSRHITIGWGRDYGDVSPLRGVILGGGAHDLRVGVSVIPLGPDEWRAALAEVAVAAG